jgi:hypothetical protein
MAGFFDPNGRLPATTVRTTDPDPPPPPLVGDPPPDGSPAVPGLPVQGSDLQAYYAGKPVPMDDDSFQLSLWLRPGENPLLLRQQIGYALRLWRDVVNPTARFYKRRIYGDPDYPARIVSITYGIVSSGVVRSELKGGPASRHLLGQAVNFQVDGVDPARVVSDIQGGALKVLVGTYGVSTGGVHASLPFYAAGQPVTRMRLWADPGVPGSVRYSFN